jgi:hypothetical protein
MWDKLLGQKKHVGQMALSNIPPFKSYTYTFGTKKKNKTTLGKFFVRRFFSAPWQTAKISGYPLKIASRCPKA